MTTLAGSKMRRYRETQEPKLTREAFGDRFGLPKQTVLGLEEKGKRPRGQAGADLVNRLAEAGICDHADWYRPARCPDCGVASDDAAAMRCDAGSCALAVRQVA